ncbi:MAG: trigger factor [Acidobacteria bacterium]|nr:trigger factor [Acidobacteriota bacterium]
MKTELKEMSPTRREIRIRIEPAALKAEYGKVTEKYARGVSVPGFRKGYAPNDVVRLRYKEEIKSEVLQKVLPTAVTEAIQEHKLQPLGEPQMHIDEADNINVNGSEPIDLHVQVEVMPEIPVPKYEGIEIMRRVKPVGDGEVDDLIANRLNGEAALIPVEGRASEIGDTMIADLEGVFHGEANTEPIVANDLEIKLGDEVIEKSFTENLLGLNPEDEKEFTVAYPADFSSPALAGKTVKYKALIKSVGTMERPEANDEWAKSLDEGYKSLSDLRDKLRSDLEKYAQADADARVRNNAIAKLIDENAFEVPSVLIDSQARNLLDNFARDLQQRGADLNQVNEDFVKMAYSQMRTQAERDVRGAMLLDKVAELENVSVEAKEIDDEVAKMAEYYRMTADDFRAALEKQGGTASIENNLKTRKSIEALVAKATITGGPWLDESVDQAASKADETEAQPKAPARTIGKSAAAAAANKEEKPKAAKKKSAE